MSRPSEMYFLFLSSCQTIYKLYIVNGQSLFNGDAAYGTLFTLLTASSEIAWNTFNRFRHREHTKVLIFIVKVKRWSVEKELANIRVCKYTCKERDVCTEVERCWFGLQSILYRGSFPEFHKIRMFRRTKESVKLIPFNKQLS